MSNKYEATFHPHHTIDNAREAVLLALIKELEADLHEMRWHNARLARALREYQQKETT